MSSSFIFSDKQAHKINIEIKAVLDRVQFFTLLQTLGDRILQWFSNETSILKCVNQPINVTIFFDTGVLWEQGASMENRILDVVNAATDLCLIFGVKPIYLKKIDKLGQINSNSSRLFFTILDNLFNTIKRQKCNGFTTLFRHLLTIS